MVKIISQSVLAQNLVHMCISSSCHTHFPQKDAIFRPNPKIVEAATVSVVIFRLISSTVFQQDFFYRMGLPSLRPTLVFHPGLGPSVTLEELQVDLVSMITQENWAPKIQFKKMLISEVRRNNGEFKSLESRAKMDASVPF